MLVRHAGLALDVPPSWVDQSTLLFVAPREEDALPTQVRVRRPTETLAVTFVVDGAHDARALLDEQATKLKQIDPEYELLSEGPFECALGAGWHFQQRVHVGSVVVRQIAMACVVNDVGVMATAATADARFVRCEPELRAMLASLQPARSP